MASESKLTNETQNSRRVKYGLNVTVAIVVATLLVICLNWVAYRHFHRWDFTATRQYSLSQQSLKVLGSISEPHQIVTLLATTGPYADQAHDLIDEYDRYGKNVSVQHIDPSREITRLDKFYSQLRDRYASELEGVDTAITQGRQAVSNVRKELALQRTLLEAAVKDTNLTDPELRQFVGSVATAFARFDTQFDEADARVTRSLDQTLPDYTEAINLLRNLLNDLDEKVFAIAVDRFDRSAKSGSTPGSVKDALLRLNDQFSQSRKNLRDPLTQLKNTTVPANYEQLRGQLATPDTVVVLGPEQVQVLRLEQMFRQPDPSQLEPGQHPELRFLGEEVITGALISMSLKDKPLVVFVYSGQQPALGPGGTHSQVADRLRKIGFDVQQWSPSGQPGPMGQPMPPGPMPEPKAGQKVVWVLMPSEPPNPMNPMAGQGLQEAMDKINERLARGDALLVSVAFSPTAGFGMTDPVTQLLDTWGIRVRRSEIVHRQMQLPNGRTMGNPQLEINQWPDDLPITKALAGIQGVFALASPIELQDSTEREGQKIEHYTLATVQGQGLWAETNLQEPKFDQAKAAPSFTVAVAAESGSNRLVVVADPIWSTDDVTTYGLLGRGTADLVGASFPANAELFVNSVYWLAELDQLIAASPRTQDIRRVEPMTFNNLVALRWALLLGMPLGTAAAGIGVWLVRRRE